MKACPKDLLAVSLLEFISRANGIAGSWSFVHPVLPDSQNRLYQMAFDLSLSASPEAQAARTAVYTGRYCWGPYAHPFMEGIL